METISELRKVYDYLADEESREIFRLRMEYLITGDHRPIEIITEKYLPMLRSTPLYSIDEILKLSEDKRIICYGAGDDALFYAEYWRKFPLGKIAAFCDRNKELQETGFLGYKVISPEKLMVDYSGAFIVISSTIFGEEIKRNLLSMGFSTDQILTCIFPPLSGVENQYFDPNIIKFNKSGEIYIDGGSMDLSSVRQMSALTNVKKAYAFEPNPDHFKRCKNIKEELGLEIELYPFGLWSEKTELRFEPRSDGGSYLTPEGSGSVRVCTVEDVVAPGERVTFINLKVV